MNILIVDDHPLTCRGLAALLVSTRPTAQVRSAHTAATAMAALQSLPAPDWVFLDVHLPDDPQLTLFHHLCMTPWIERTILISAKTENHLIRTALAAGARGFLPKSADPSIVQAGFEKILNGEFFTPPELADQLRAAPTHLEAHRNLSPRLLQVQSYLLRGASNKVIARDLQLSAHTIKEYVSSVLAYYGVASRLELVLKLGADSEPTSPLKTL
jgi:two-component system, NarL family, nitrate/nitrite response regulator NarL